MTKQLTTEQAKHFATLAKNHTAFLKRFQKANPNFSFETLHFHDEERLKKLNTLRIPHDSFKAQLGTAKRLSRLHHDPAVQSKLLKNGFHSAQQVTQVSERTFVSTYAKPLGLSSDATTQVYNNAVATQEKVRLMLANVKTTVGSPHYQALKLTNVGDDVTTYFEQLPSYQEIFGNQDYCSCAECKSIFGAAAYFVDLMRIIDKYITTPNTATIPTQPTNLTFPGRRPDLPLIPLTCENTNTLIPYITIVIERLFALVSTQLGLSSNISQAYQTLATTTTYPFQLPYNLPLTQIRNYLTQLNLSLATVYASGKVAPSSIASEQFGFSFDQTNILTTQATGATLNGYYGYPSTTDLVSTLTPIATFMFQAKLLVDAFQVLLIQDLSPTEIGNNVAHNFFINQGFSSTSYLQISTDSSGNTTFTNLSTDTCDRLNRFIRFSQNANVDFITLDWLLRVGSGTTTTAISAASIQQASAMLMLAQQLKTDAVTAASLFGPMKTYGSGLDGTAQSLFDRIYNNPNILQGATPYQPTGNALNSGYTSTIINWTPGATDTTNTTTLSWLASSLNLSQDDTNILGTKIFTATSTPLTVENLSALYRHAFLAAQLNQTITQYIVLLDLSPLNKTQPFTTDQVAQLLLTVQQFKTNRLTVYDASYFISGRANQYALPVYDAATVNKWLQLLWSSNPNGTATPQGDVVVCEAISNYFGCTTEIVTAVSSIFTKAIALPNGVTNWYDAFLTLPQTGSTTSPYIDYINAVLALTSQWVYLIKKLNLPATLITSVGTYPASYGFVTNFASYTPQNISSLIAFNKYFTTFGDVNQVLLRYVAAFNADPTTATPILCNVTGWNLAQTDLLIPIVANGETNLVVQIGDLMGAWNVLNTLKTDVPFYQSLLALNVLPASSGWATYETTAQQTLQKIQAVFSPSQWTGVMDQLNSRIALSTRDALLSIALWQLNSLYKDIQTTENVYEYLLIDVNMGDTTMISYIREGLNACQLYLQRCRLRIEQGVAIMDIPDSWWEWMMQYRLWEANRQIFVYP
ncbi:MAG: neuraminidase-like domain-containing protein, partial [Bacteroidia bacterium]